MNWRLKTTMLEEELVTPHELAKVWGQGTGESFAVMLHNHFAVMLEENGENHDIKKIKRYKAPLQFFL